MSVDFEEDNNSLPQGGSFNYQQTSGKPVGKITQLFMALGLGRNQDAAQVFVLIVAIIFFALAGFIYFF